MAADTMNIDWPTPAHGTSAGMTLTELLIVVVIVGILAGIAYPSYRKQVVRSNRTDAKVALQQYAQSLENCFIRSNSYSAGCEIAGKLGPPGLDSNDRHYKIMIKVGDVGDLVFKLTAVPQGAQATSDAECGNFTLDQENGRGVSGAKGTTACWK